MFQMEHVVGVPMFSRRGVGGVDKVAIAVDDAVWNRGAAGAAGRWRALGGE